MRQIIAISLPIILLLDITYISHSYLFLISPLLILGSYFILSYNKTNKDLNILSRLGIVYGIFIGHFYWLLGFYYTILKKLILVIYYFFMHLSISDKD